MACVASAAGAARRPRAGWLSAALSAVRVWRARVRERRLLGAFDERMLRDVGICAADARREAVKPFWRD